MKSLPSILEKALRQGGSGTFLSTAGLALGSTLLASVLLLLVWAAELSWGARGTGDYVSVRKGQGLLSEQTFSPQELTDLAAQPGVRDLVPVKRADYSVYGTLDLSGSSFGSMLFLEAIPDEHLDKALPWTADDPSRGVPILIGEGFLYLYNSAFAPANNLPQLNASMLGMVPLKLNLTGPGGSMAVKARIVGLTGRMDSILVPERFISWSNGMLHGSGEGKGPGKVLLVLNGREQAALRDYCLRQGYDFVGTSFAGSALLSWAGAVSTVVLVFALFMIVLSLSQVLLGLRLSLVLGAEVQSALLHWNYPRQTIRALQLRMVRRPQMGTALVVMVLMLLVWLVLGSGQAGPGAFALLASWVGAWFAPTLAMILSARILRF